jgi:hypothetical protein
LRVQRDTQQGLTRREALKRGAVLAGGLVWATPVVQAVGMSPAYAQIVSPFCRTIDFDGQNEGDKIGDLEFESQPWSSVGVNMTSGGSANPASHPLMIFDSASPTGGDSDLGTPNAAFGGPGVGAGGASGAGINEIDRFKVLIISEDGISSNPDDRASGGTIITTFDNPVQVKTVGLLDIDTNGTSIVTYTPGGTFISSTPVPNRGENSWQSIDVDETGVGRLEIVFDSSGAVTDFEFCEIPPG